MESWGRTSAWPSLRWLLAACVLRAPATRLPVENSIDFRPGRGVQLLAVVRKVLRENVKIVAEQRGLFGEGRWVRGVCGGAALASPSDNGFGKDFGVVGLDGRHTTTHGFCWVIRHLVN